MAERLSLKVGEDELIFETGRIAKQAQGSVLVISGESMVLSTVCVTDPRPGIDFFPLTVEYREKSYAAGRIPGNFFRREARPSERETLVCRLTDRPLRPLFPDGYHDEVQIFSTVMSADNVHNPDVMSINGASAALHISKVPFNGPIGAVRVGLFDGQFAANPPMEQMVESDLDLIVAGTKDAIMMVEGQAYEIPEDVLVDALDFAHNEIKRICEVIEQLRERCGEEKMVFEPPAKNEEVSQFVNEAVAGRFVELTRTTNKKDLYTLMDTIGDDVHAAFKEKYGEEKYAEVKGDISAAYHDAVSYQLRKQVLEENKRIDGRGLRDVRPISIELGVLPRAHGSVLFTRGETQAIVTTTLGTPRDEQRSEELWGQEFKRFFLHYNFPPYSVGEVKRISGPGRREVGHGKLAERACIAILPFDAEEDPEGAAHEEFQYTVRVVSEITESNGSSSMASVCGATLSMMDAGVPIQAPVAGVAMGLIKEGGETRILTDILGTEDHLGDMDFKVCGSYEGVTAVQMDIKVAGITRETMREALEHAKSARIHILDIMQDALPEPRKEISPYAPRIYQIKINPEFIGDVIGPGGRVVREIQKQSGAQITIEDDGVISVSAVDEKSARMAIDLIQGITAEPEVGAIYEGVVTRIMAFGAFVSIMGGKEGLVHISELAPTRINDVTDVVQIGDEIEVKVVEIDSMGRLNLSKLAADIERGRVDPSEVQKDNGNRGDRGRHGGGDRGRSGGGDRGGRRGGAPQRGGGRPRR